jgi:hypothetical protein
MAISSSVSGGRILRKCVERKKPCAAISRLCTGTRCWRKERTINSATWSQLRYPARTGRATPAAREFRYCLPPRVREPVCSSLCADEVAGATICTSLPFAREAKGKPPFPRDPHYDAKAWEQCAARRGLGRVLFWNVAGRRSRSAE